MCANANKTLGLIKRVCSRAISETDTRKLLYCALVRPRLEYASNVWSPYTAKHRRLIENVQRRATKFVLNYPPHKTSYTDRLAALDLLPLEYRREISDLVLLCKYRTGLINAAFNKNFVPVCRSYNTRNFDQHNYRAITCHKQNYFRFSFFPRSINLWNNLPQNLKCSSSLTQFRNPLYAYYKDKLPIYQPP